MARMLTQSFQKHIWLTWILTLRELKGRYKTATLGFLWAFINPLLQLLVLSLVFSIFLKVEVPNYPIFLLSGILPWTYFSSALTQGTSSLINSRDIIKKTFFPRQVIPLSAVAAAFINFVLSLILFLILALLLTPQISINILFILLASILQTALIVGVVLITSSLEIYYRDVSFIMQAVILVWFYLTPIIYPFSFVPENYSTFYMLNPMVGITSIFRAAFLGTTYINTTAILISLTEAFILMTLGWWTFKKRQRFFPDWA